GGEEFLDGARHRYRVVRARHGHGRVREAVEGIGLGAVGGVPAAEEARADPLGEAGAPLVYGLRGAQEGDVAAAASDEVVRAFPAGGGEVEVRSEEHTSELQSRENLVCRLL